MQIYSLMIHQVGFKSFVVLIHLLVDYLTHINIPYRHIVSFGRNHREDVFRLQQHTHRNQSVDKNMFSQIRYI